MMNLGKRNIQWRYIQSKMLNIYNIRRCSISRSRCDCSICSIFTTQDPSDHIPKQSPLLKHRIIWKTKNSPKTPFLNSLNNISWNRLWSPNHILTSMRGTWRAACEAAGRSRRQASRQCGDMLYLYLLLSEGVKSSIQECAFCKATLLAQVCWSQKTPVGQATPQSVDGQIIMGNCTPCDASNRIVWIFCQLSVTSFLAVAK